MTAQKMKQLTLRTNAGKPLFHEFPKKWQPQYEPAARLRKILIEQGMMRRREVPEITTREVIYAFRILANPLHKLNNWSCLVEELLINGESYLRLVDRIPMKVKDEWERTSKPPSILVSWLGGTPPTPPSPPPIDAALDRGGIRATYQFALFRAITEIADSHRDRVRMLHNGNVAVPVQFVAELWFRYYWPIFASNTFIPQMADENPNGSPRIRFREDQTEIIQHYRTHGGYAGFVAERDAGTCPGEINDLYNRTIKSIVIAIQKPIEHVQRDNFDYRFGTVIVRNHMWQTVVDSLLIINRWAEATEEMSAGTVRSQTVIRLLTDEMVNPPGFDRQTHRRQ